jgi:nicotinate-nucleotide adenylyltransferase
VSTAGETPSPDRPAASAPRVASAPRIGILGGTFNPPHLAHLELARHAVRELALERVLLMPARLPPHKTAAADPGAARRLEMCRLLVADEATVDVSALELERDGPSYTVDTLRALHAAHPRISLTFILGADIARTLPTWREPHELLALCELAVALRAARTSGEVMVAIAPLLHRGAGEDRVRFLSMPPLDISSSLVRERLTRGESIVQLVGPTVAAYVDRNQLYRAPVTQVSAS